MSLLVLKEHLSRLPRASSVQELSAHLGAQPSMVRQWLAHWLRKGTVRLSSKTPLCGSRCHRCLPESIEMYEWIHVD